MSGAEISEAELIRNLKTIATELGRPPQVQDIRDRSQYSYHTYRRRFGGIGQALDAADIEHDQSTVNRGPNKIDDQSLLEELQTLFEELGRPPKIDDIRQRCTYSQTTYYNHFGSLNSALSRANIPIRTDSE